MCDQNAFGVFKFLFSNVAVVTQFAELGNAENFACVESFVVFDPVADLKGNEYQDEYGNRNDHAIEKNLRNRPRCRLTAS